MADDRTSGLAPAVRLVCVANLGYFCVEFGIALAIASVALFADSIDFLEDASVNFLILIALGWSAIARARVGMVLAILLLVPGLATLWMAATKFLSPVPPAAVPLSLTALGALAVNFVCAVVLARYRHHGGSLAKAAFLSARNDVYANGAIIVAGGLTAWFDSAWPDLITGIGIAALNAGAAREVWEAARAERHEASA
jgi:Co/Zn/Cd efflux system component